MAKFTHKGEGIIYSLAPRTRTRPWTKRSPSIKGGRGRRVAGFARRAGGGRPSRCGEPRVRAPAERGPSPSSRGRAARPGVHKPFVGPERASLGPWLRRNKAAGSRSRPADVDMRGTRRDGCLRPPVRFDRDNREHIRSSTIPRVGTAALSAPRYDLYAPLRNSTTFRASRGSQNAPQLSIIARRFSSASPRRYDASTLFAIWCASAVSRVLCRKRRYFRSPIGKGASEPVYRQFAPIHPAQEHYHAHVAKRFAGARAGEN